MDKTKIVRRRPYHDTTLPNAEYRRKCYYMKKFDLTSIEYEEKFGREGPPRKWNRRKKFPLTPLERNRKYQYGMTKEEFDETETLQNGCCAICNKKPYRYLEVDHAHETGKIRGLVCHRCNTRLRFVDKYLWLSRRLLEYVERFRED